MYLKFTIYILAYGTMLSLIQGRRRNNTHQALEQYGTMLSSKMKTFLQQTNKKKNISESLDPVSVKIGRLTYITIPIHLVTAHSAFHSEDLSFTLRTADNLPLYKSSWIQFNRELNQIEAFPLKGNEGQFRFLLIPLIANQPLAEKYFINVNVESEENVYMHRVTFSMGANSFRLLRERKTRIEFVQLLVSYLRSMGLFVRLREIVIIESNSRAGSVVWLLTLVKPSTCDTIITKDLPTYLLKDRKPNVNLLAVFSGKFHITDVRIELIPPCYILPLAKESDTDNKFIAPLVISIVVMVLVSPVVIALIIRRKFRRKRRSYRQGRVTGLRNNSAHIQDSDNLDNYYLRGNRNLSFSCWIFSRKGKSFKVNKEFRNHNKRLSENIFDSKFVQRDRLGCNAALERTDPLSRKKRLRTGGYRDKAAMVGSERSQKISRNSALSEVSSHQSYSTSQETHQSNYSLDRRRFDNSLSINSLPCRSGEVSPNSYQSGVNKPPQFVVSDANRRPSVHLINTKPKTVNIYAPTDVVKSRQVDQRYFHNNNNKKSGHTYIQRSLESDDQRRLQGERYFDNGRYALSPRRHSLEPKGHSLEPKGHSLEPKQEVVWNREKNPQNFSQQHENIQSTPQYGTSRGYGTPTNNNNKLSIVSPYPRNIAEHHYLACGGTSRPVSADHIRQQTMTRFTSNALQRSSSLDDVASAVPRNNINEYEGQYYQDINKQQQQQQTGGKNPSIDTRIRKSSLIRRQEFLASRRKKAIELASCDETQYFAAYTRNPPDNEDAV